MWVLSGKSAKLKTCEQKFICTYINPTGLPFPELYECTNLSKFVAEYITYEPLSDPFQLVRYWIT